MWDKGPPGNHRLQALFKEESERISLQYRVTPDEALSALTASAQAHPTLQKKLDRGEEDHAIQRLREYRQAVKEAKRSIYNRLRRYCCADPQDLAHSIDLLAQAVDQADLVASASLISAMLANHASTRERLPFCQDFHDQLFAPLPYPTSVLDVGAGLYPLMFPHRPGLRLVAIERDPACLAILRLASELLPPGCLAPLGRPIAEVAWPDLLDEGQPFDLALLLKVIPVIKRQERELLPHLAQIPARHLVITGSTEALAKRSSIASREMGDLRAFARLTGYKILGEIRISTEVGLILEAPQNGPPPQIS